ILSPQKTFPHGTPYRPPVIVVPDQTSTDDASPNRYNVLYASSIPPVIQVPFCPFRFIWLQYPITVSNARSCVTENTPERNSRRILLLTFISSGNNTNRCLGAYHNIRSSSLNQGKIPMRYASIRR